MDAPKIVVVGYTKVLMDLLSGMLPADSVTVLEEPDVIARRRLDDAPDRHPCLRAVVASTYQSHQWPAPDEAAGVLAEEAVAVLPASEYAVPAAARLAAIRGLPGAGLRAAYLLRNKDALRARMEGYVAQPEWICPDSDEELAVFADKHGGSVVLKPSNGQASAGVVRCDSIDDVFRHRGSFEDFAGDPLRSSSIARPRLMAEQRLFGPEFSVECLVRDGIVIFTNITAKTVAAGAHPVELGHVAPAPVDRWLEERLRTTMTRLVRLARVRTAVLHAEWIVEGEVPHLIECAGRLPGDNITALIGDAWGFNFVDAWVTLMRGERPQLPLRPRGAAAIWFLSGPEGTVRSVTGVADATSLPGVLAVDVTVGPGDRTSMLRNSWSRIGHVMASGSSATAAMTTAQRAAELVEVTVG